MIGVPPLDAINILIAAGSAVGGAVTAAGGLWLAQKRINRQEKIDKDQQFRDLIRAAASDVVEAGAREVARAHQLLERERLDWREERREWQEERTAWKRERASLLSRIEELEKEIDELRVQVNGGGGV